MTFSQKLKGIRNTLGLSQEQFADRLRVSRQAVTKWESGEGMPDAYNMKEIAKLSGHSLDYLLDNEANDQKQSGFFKAVHDAFVHYSDFEGRANRRSFWWYAVFVMLSLALCDVFDFVMVSDAISLTHVLASIFAISTLIPSLAIGVRRLRDSGKEWQQMYWILVPVFGFFYLCYLWLKPSTTGAKSQFLNKSR